MDTAATIYNFWWQYYSIFKLHSSPWFNTMINYPDGYSMVLFPLYLTYGIFSWPLQALFGSPQAISGFFNWISILSFAFTGLLGFLLAREITESEQAGLLAGILFSFLPFHFWHLPRCHTSCLELLVLPVFFYFRMLRLKDLKAGIAFGVSLVPLFYQSPNYVIYLTMFFGLDVLYMLGFARSELDGKWLKALAAGIAIAAALASPLLFETGKEILRNSTPATSTLQEQTRYSANLAGFVLPGERQLVYRGLGRISERLIDEHGVSGKEIFPGYILLVSGLLGIFWGRKNIRHYGFWLGCLVIFIVVSLGPYLSAAGKTFFSVPLPYYYLRKLFFFFAMDRSPVRIIILSLLALSIFSAGFFKRVGQIFSGGESAVIFSILCLLAFIELFQVPMQVSRVELPAPYRQIASEARPIHDTGASAAAGHLPLLGIFPTLSSQGPCD